MGKCVFNRETSKIELHFSKPEYLALSDTQKKEIKSSFLWSKVAGAWVSRSTRDHYWARKIAEKLGLEDAGSTGERLSYAEELARKAERAEARAERMETYADNAEKRGAAMQAEMNHYHGDIAFFTQPNINSSAGRTFTNRRQRILDRYTKGFEEYRKSDYFRGRAETARATAEMKRLRDAVYLHNRIKECNAEIKGWKSSITKAENTLSKLQQGEVITGYGGKTLQAAEYENWLNEALDKVEYLIDKLAFFENALDELGGIKFSPENIKPGYVVKMQRWGRCEIVSAGPVNISFKILDGGAAGGVLTEPYAAIAGILAEKEAPKVVNPFAEGDILCKYRPGDGSIYKAYQVVKVTKTGVKIRQIAVKNGEPMPGQFISDKVMQKKVVKSKFSDWVGVYDDDWQLHRYEVKEMAGAV